MRKVRNGDTVRVHYTKKLENSEVFANLKDGEPFECPLGTGKINPGLERGIVEFEVVETKTITVSPEEPFGLQHEELVRDVKRGKFPENISLVIGQRLQIN